MFRITHTPMGITHLTVLRHDVMIWRGGDSRWHLCHTLTDSTWHLARIGQVPCYVLPLQVTFTRRDGSQVQVPSRRDVWLVQTTADYRAGGWRRLRWHLVTARVAAHIR